MIIEGAAFISFLGVFYYTLKNGTYQEKTQAEARKKQKSQVYIMNLIVSYKGKEWIVEEALGGVPTTASEREKAYTKLYKKTLFALNVEGYIHGIPCNDVNMFRIEQIKAGSLVTPQQKRQRVFIS